MWGNDTGGTVQFGLVWYSLVLPDHPTVLTLAVSQGMPVECIYILRRDWKKTFIAAAKEEQYMDPNTPPPPPILQQ